MSQTSTTAATTATDVPGAKQQQPSVPIIAVSNAEDTKTEFAFHESEVLIIGAGVVGCAMAVAMGKQGRKVTVLERSLKEPDRIVGELLQPGGVEALEQLGLVECMDGIDAVEVEGYDVIFHGTEVEIPYPADKTGVSPRGRSFHHGRFIMKLREAARATPNVTIIEATATSLIKSHSDVIGAEVIVDGKPDRFLAPLTIAADGYASKFRKDYHAHTPEVKSKFWALELIDAKLPMPLHGHVFIGEGPPVLMYQIGTHETRALIDIPENLPTASVENGGVKGHMKNVILPQLPKAVQPSFLDAIENSRLRSMPNSFLPCINNKTRGLIIVGDASNMRHPLTGGGMTVAFHDVVLLRDLLSPENVPSLKDTPVVTKTMKTFYWQRKKTASTINILAQALYSLFAANDPYLKILQRGCFRYFEMGMIEAPCGMLAGLIKQPTVLIRHFFAVAFLAIYLNFAETPFYLWPLALFQGIAVLWTACRVIMPYVFAELRG